MVRNHAEGPLMRLSASNKELVDLEIVQGEYELMIKRDSHAIFINNKDVDFFIFALQRMQQERDQK